jgi:hypothetical protein
MSAAASHPSYFIWWYAYCSHQSSGPALAREPSWRHAFIRFGENALMLETLVPSAHHLHKGSELHHDAGGAAEHQHISLSSDKEGDLILGEELNQVVMKRLQCAIEHSVLIQNASSSALVEFRNANERREFVNYAAQLILEAHVNLVSVTKRSSPSPQKAVILALKESPAALKAQTKFASTERILSDFQSRVIHETSPLHFVKIDLDDLSRSTSNAHQSLNKLTQHLQTAIHKSHVPGNAQAYSSGDDEDIGGWNYWGFVPQEQHVNVPLSRSALTFVTATGLDSSAALSSHSQEVTYSASSKKNSTRTSPNQQQSVSHGTQTSAVYQTMMSKYLPKDAVSSSQSVKAKMRIPKSQLERNSFTEMTSDWSKTLRSHMPVPNRAVSPHSPRRHISSPPKSPRNVQFSTTTQFVSSQVSVDALLSDEVQKVRPSADNSKHGSSLSPKRFSPASNQKPEGSYAEWFEKKRAALALVGSMSFREKKSSTSNISNTISPFKGGVLNSRSDFKASRKESPHTPRGDSYVSVHLHNNSSQQPKSSGSSHENKPRSRSVPKERKTVVTTPPRVWRIPDLDHHSNEASEPASKVVKHRSANYGNGSVSFAQPKSALKSQNPQAVAKMSPQFFQLNQDDFVELISSRESTLSPNFNHRQDPSHRQVSSGERDAGGSGAGPPELQRQRRFSVFTQKKITKLEPEISSFMASPEFQSLPVRLQKAFAIGQKNVKHKDHHSQRLFKP